MASGHGASSLFTITPFVGTGGFAAIAAGAAIAACSFLGFDAVSTLTEETRDAQKNIPRAIVLVALIGGVIFMVVSYTVSLVAPGSDFPNADSLAADIARTIGGAGFAGSRVPPPIPPDDAVGTRRCGGSVCSPPQDRSERRDPVPGASIG